MTKSGMMSSMCVGDDKPPLKQNPGEKCLQLCICHCVLVSVHRRRKNKLEASIWTSDFVHSIVCDKAKNAIEGFSQPDAAATGSCHIEDCNI